MLPQESLFWHASMNLTLVIVTGSLFSSIQFDFICSMIPLPVISR
uniref:Uncharacterized protein n=1 Tax=Arundo donax TaxID=35708 RepID=A0A0A9A0V1_ARUDO